VITVAAGDDVGTTRARVGVDEAGRVIAAAGSPYPLLTPRPLWSEQDPPEWWRATQTVLAEITGCVGGQHGSVAGIGLTGQRHGSVFPDSSGEVIRRALAWSDQRAAAQGAWNLYSVYRDLYPQTGRDMHRLSALAGR
jgi:xylulokinase